MASTITRDGYVFLRTEGSTKTELSVQRIDSNTDNPLAQIKMFGSGKDNFQGVLSFETINSGSSDGPTEERMRIHTNGNVGVGTLEPNAKLEVDGTVKATEFVGDGSKLTGINTSKWSDAPGGAIYYGKGNVGIGTADPGDKLTISEGDLKIEGGRYRRLKIVSDSYWAGIELVVREDGEAGNPHIDFTHGELGSPNYGIRLYAPTNDKFVIQGGNVGIGTADPRAKLDVRGTITTSGHNIELTKQASGNRYSYIDFHGDDTYTDYGLRVIRYNTGADAESRIHHRGAGILRLYTQESGSHIVLQPGGNVGIGTADPQDKLDMSSGSIRFYSGSDYQRIFANRWGLNVFTNKLTGSGLRVGEIHGGLGLYAGDGATDYHLGLVAGSGKGVGIAGDAKNPFTGNGLFVASNGRVGIGTTSPSAKLHVGGDFRIDGDFEFPNNSKVKFDMGSYNADYDSPDWNISVGDTQYFHGSSWFYKRFSINDDGDLYCAGSKAGYVVDYFVNRVGDTLEQGDVVVISKYQVSHYSGDKNNIPIPEVDLTDRAYDSRVCGIISKVVTEKDLPCVEVECGAQAKPMNPEEKKPDEVVPSKHPLREFAAKISEKMDYTKVQDKQIGQMVTMGCFAHCKVDADITPIEMGDLLTTSPTNGHAQKVLEPEKAVGAIIGKALGPLKKGKGKIPILVMLQ